MGYHLYHFYEDDEKLAEVLAKFFDEGLRKLEYCMWIAPEGITESKAISMLKKHIPNIEDYLLKRQMSIVEFEDWYLTEEGIFDKEAALEKFQIKYDDIMMQGYVMMRASGTASATLKENYWSELIEYEAIVNEKIDNMNVVAVCVYKGKMYKPTELQAILQNHFCPLTPNP